MVGSHGAVSVYAVLNLDAQEPVVLRVKCVCCATGWVPGTAAYLCKPISTSRSAYQQVESVALSTNIQVEKISAFAVPTC